MRNLKNNKKRPPIVEGIFYPSDKEELLQMIQSFSEGKEYGEAQIILSPHAGYATAGQQIADAFLSAANRKIDEIVVISHVHREERDNIILPSFSNFGTAAGDIEINMKSLHLFKGEDSTIIKDNIPHLEEHAIEDQLPFISALFKDVKILPILLGKTTISTVKKLTKGLSRAYGNNLDNILFVISSNLSNYEDEMKAMEKANRAIQVFSKGDWREICEEKRTGMIDACGAGALAAVLALYNKTFKLKELSRSKSEGKESEKGKIVSYGALAFTRIYNGTINKKR